jgi:hypothetical protein
MKNISITLIALFLSVSAIAQNREICEPCLPEGVTFRTQEHIDNFQTNFPGCTMITGNVTILGSSSITNLNGLSVLTSIGGGLTIRFNYYLVSLEGLDNLTQIGGTLLIRSNPSLTTCDADWLCGLIANTEGPVIIQENATGCNSVIEVALSCDGLPCLANGEYWIHSQADIDNFSLAFPACHALQGDVYINGNDITNLDGLSQINAIDGGLFIGVYSSDQGNPLLTSLIGLQNLESVTNLRIRHNPSLSELTGLENIESLSYLDIYQNEALSDLTGLSGLASIEDLFSVINNNSLALCDDDWFCNLLTNTGGAINIIDNAPGCNSIVEIAISCGGLPCLPLGNYLISSQNDIDNFSQAFNGCNALEGFVQIKGDDITNLAGLSQITSIGKGLGIEHNNSLITLNGLNNLTSIGTDFYLYDNPALTNLVDINNLTTTGGFFIIGLNNSLKSLNGLNSLASVGTDFSIHSNDSLSSLSGLENLNIIGGRLSFHYNNSLTSLHGLENLSSTGDGLLITNNYALSNVVGLANLVSIGGGVLDIKSNNNLSSLVGLESIVASSIMILTIESNSSLSHCEVQSVCDFLSTSAGSFHISYNAPGCNTFLEIEEACETVGLEETTPKSEFTISPNPASNKIKVTSKNELNIETITIYNQLGQKILQIDESKDDIDISALGQGIYIVELTSNELKARQKMIIEK